MAQQSPEIIALTSPESLSQAAFQSREAGTPSPSWHAGCPVSPTDLRDLMLSYWDFGGVARRGHLIVHRAVASEAIEIFQDLFRHGFLIDRMEPVDNFNGSDDRSMEANNTSAFNCRDITGKPGVYSNHSWGRAIDINPLTNPYLKADKVLPAAGRAYLDRSRAYPGVILPASFIVKLFERHGWTWGGSWTELKDYQHFEKPDRR